MLEAFFFFVGGIQPRVKVLDPAARRCPRCGLHQAYLKRVDHYLSLFFIPVFKVKTGEPVLICEHCAQPVGGRGAEEPPEPAAESKRCRSCQQEFPADYTFCPQCGRRL